MITCIDCVCLHRCGWPTLSTLVSTRALCMPVPLASAPTCALAVCPVGFCTTTSESSTWRYCGHLSLYQSDIRLGYTNTHRCLFALFSVNYDSSLFHQMWNHHFLTTIVFCPLCSFSLSLSVSSVSIAVLLCPCSASCYGGNSFTQLPPTTQTLTAWRETPSVFRWVFAPLYSKEEVQP